MTRALRAIIFEGKDVDEALKILRG